jgi:hypothetical protein
LVLVEAVDAARLQSGFGPGVEGQRNAWYPFLGRPLNDVREPVRREQVV